MPDSMTYDIYCEWCRLRNQPEPTREWWDKACASVKAVPTSDILTDEQVHKLLADDQADIDTERREGWAYD